MTVRTDWNSIVRRKLATEWGIAPSLLTDDFRWLDALEGDDIADFLADLNNSAIPQGLSFGGGKLFSTGLDDNRLNDIATVGGLVAYLQQRSSS
jgi:hypothetical protein